MNDPPPCFHGNRRLDPKLPGFQDTNIGGVQRRTFNSEHPYRRLEQNIDFVDAQSRAPDTYPDRPHPPQSGHDRLSSGSKTYIAFSIVEKLILDSIWASSWPPLGPKNSDFAREGYQKSTFSLFLVLTSSELNFYWILVSLEPPQESQSRRRDLLKRLRDRL